MSFFRVGAIAPKPYNYSQLFTASGSFIVPSGVMRVRLTLVGGGSRNTLQGQTANGYLITREVSVTPGESLTVIVGAANNADYGGEGGSSVVSGAFGTVKAQGGCAMHNTNGTLGGPGWGEYGISGSNAVAGAVLIEW